MIPVPYISEKRVQPANSVCFALFFLSEDEGRTKKGLIWFSLTSTSKTSSINIQNVIQILCWVGSAVCVEKKLSLSQCKALSVIALPLQAECAISERSQYVTFTAEA